MDLRPNSKKYYSPKIWVTAVVLVTLVAVAAILFYNWPSPGRGDKEYPWHIGIAATVFWIGEDANDSNDFIHNKASAWTPDWVSAYSGVDHPDKLCDYKPCDFTPGENPFYAAVPYNDLDEMCQPKSNQNSVYWFEHNTGKGGTLLKNRWIQIRHNDKSAYAQIEDVGPFESDDVDYVFGDQQPKEPRAGLDISPAAAKYLGISGRGEVDWRFVEASAVPAGPWTEFVTRSGPSC